MAAVRFSYKAALRLGPFGASLRANGVAAVSFPHRLPRPVAGRVGVPVDEGAELDDLEVGDLDAEHRLLVDADRVPGVLEVAVVGEGQRDVAAVGEEHAVALQRPGD